MDFLNFNKFSFEFKINFSFSRIKNFLETPPWIFPDFFLKSILKSKYKKIEGGDIPNKIKNMIINLKNNNIIPRESKKIKNENLKSGLGTCDGE